MKLLALFAPSGDVSVQGLPPGPPVNAIVSAPSATSITVQYELDSEFIAPDSWLLQYRLQNAADPATLVDRRDDRRRHAGDDCERSEGRHL